MPPRQYPTNKQVFGPPQNVFRPNQKPMHQLPKPTPMSTTSRNSSTLSQRQRWPNNNNYNRNQQFRNSGQNSNFTSEELFTNDYDQSDEQHYYQNQNTDDNDQNQMYYNYDKTENENFIQTSQQGTP
ncbi:dr1-associated corepressor homolog [Diorhabda sublineata]|uniref:dr1-associated corepressor homolog n=1 Tax=Diorhabda sublineata TaxID=1163346 RepID=UPI0024E17342|nr:dr1-associated corepressor homolog [Diorhabda sublineata]